MVESKQSYEECRRKRIEENKKRMEELNLGKLALAFKASTAKSSPVKRPRATPDISSLPVRRSSRIASKTRVRTAKNLSRKPPPSKPPVIRFESADPYPTAFVKADLSSFKQVVQMLTGSSNQAAMVPDPPSETKAKMVESKRSYEECRKQRLEENKKRMEELNIGKLALALKASSTPKSSPAKQVKRPRVSLDISSVPVRRSSRTANKPPPNYKEVPMEPLGSLRRSYRRGSLLNRFYASDGARQDAIERAEQLESDLGSDFPTFLKPMLQSHVSGGFWLGLPVYFCKEHLPNEDEMITLVDEDEDEFPTKYLAEKNGLSGGWRGFSIDHELVDGDALVFQLINPTTFKVYIIRASELPYDEDKDKDSDASKLDNKEKDKDSDASKLDNQDKDKDSDASQLDRIAKRTRASRKRSL
ncbi:hypothetical protein RGQ29_005548 [Quercus rubra]|uniref:TF-B3 domain-containing protein n=1 Tax=Quercus rubra TaxID=3512 RepID=A0AAN7IAZ6_QUERU|nr:hypothetical protein RGQ29_005548 [Quercus rubra]